MIHVFVSRRIAIERKKVPRVPTRSILALQVRDHVLQNVRRNPAPQRSRCISNLAFHFHHSFCLSAPLLSSPLPLFVPTNLHESETFRSGYSLKKIELKSKEISIRKKLIIYQIYPYFKKFSFLRDIEYFQLSSSWTQLEKYVDVFLLLRVIVFQVLGKNLLVWVFIVLNK